MLKNRTLLTIVFVLCAFLSGTKLDFAQTVTDNPRNKEVEAALNAEEQAAQSPQTANVQTSQPQQPASIPTEASQQPSAPVNMKIQETAAGPMPEAGSSLKIVKAIEIHGNKSIGVAQILARIKTRVGEEYQEAVVSDDLKRLYNTGHFSDVQIDHENLDEGYKVIDGRATPLEIQNGTEVGLYRLLTDARKSME